MWKTAFKKFEVIWSAQFFRGCLAQILLGSFLNILTKMITVRSCPSQGCFSTSNVKVKNMINELHSVFLNSGSQVVNMTVVQFFFILQPVSKMAASEYLLNTLNNRISTLGAYLKTKALQWTLIWTGYLIEPGRFLKKKKTTESVR